MCTGGALSQARGALSSWWNTLTTAQSPEGSAPVTVAEEVKTYENEENSQDDSADGRQWNVEELESGEFMRLFTDSSTKRVFL